MHTAGRYIMNTTLRNNFYTVQGIQNLIILIVLNYIVYVMVYTEILVNYLRQCHVLGQQIKTTVRAIKAIKGSSGWIVYEIMVALRLNLKLGQLYFEAAQKELAKAIASR